MEYFKLIAPGIFILLGLTCLAFAFKIRKPQDDILGKPRIPLYGKGSKIHLFYLGIGFILFATILLLKNKHYY